MSEVKLNPKYEISYTFTGGERHVTGLSFVELVKKLNEIEEDPHVIQGTVNIITVEV